MKNDKMKKQAAEILVCSLDKIEEKALPELNAMYFRNIDRGGGALIISNNSEMLFVDPFYVNFEEHIEKFLKGERSQL